jgi:hypothetical protein
MKSLLFIATAFVLLNIGTARAIFAAPDVHHEKASASILEGGPQPVPLPDPLPDGNCGGPSGRSCN